MEDMELVKLMDSYMGNDGYYMKPKVEDGVSSFFMAKGDATSGDVKKSFDTVSSILGEKQEKELQLFSGKPRVECAVCADVPNLMETVPDNEEEEELK